LQFAAFTVICSASILILTHSSLDNFSICHEEKFATWTNDFLTFYFGGSVFICVILILRVILPFLGLSEGSVKYPEAILLTQSVSVIICLSLGAERLLPHVHPCSDYLGVKTSPFLFFDWICTLPFLFYLASIIDEPQRSATWKDALKEILCGLGLLFFILLSALSKTDVFLYVALFFLSAFFIIFPLFWQQYESNYAYQVAKSQFIKDQEENHSFNPDLYTAFTLANCKFNLSALLSIFSLIFPVLYWLRAMHWFDDDVYCVLMFGFSLTTKFFFIQLISDCHIELLDPNKYFLIEQKKKANEGRLMFLRYVFHEVRVPLNSISLGLQILDDVKNLKPEEIETVAMMKDATRFMAETLNDVLSLQKIEEGKLSLEFKPFCPEVLILSVLNNCR
jgi:hypothetical protein